MALQAVAVEVPDPAANFTHEKCFAKSLRNCTTKITKEHYFSKGILERMTNLSIEGFHWQKEKIQSVSTASLASNVLCDNHNTALSGLDSEALRFYDALTWKSRTHTGSDSGTQQVIHTFFHGEALEKWLLKMMCGAIASGTARVKGQKVEQINMEPWLRLLYLKERWQAGWGIYVPNTVGQTFALAHQLGFALLVDERDGTPKGATITVAGYKFGLVLCDNGSPDSIWRPHGIVFEERGATRVIEFGWEGNSTGLWIRSKNRNLETDEHRKTV